MAESDIHLLVSKIPLFNSIISIYAAVRNLFIVDNSTSSETVFISPLVAVL